MANGVKRMVASGLCLAVCAMGGVVLYASARCVLAVRLLDLPTVVVAISDGCVQVSGSTAEIDPRTPAWRFERREYKMDWLPKFGLAIPPAVVAKYNVMQLDLSPFFAVNTSRTATARSGTAFAPAWLPSAVTIVPGLLLLRSGYRRWRRRPGSCTRCGYDRRGISAEVVCPECGAAPAAAAGAAASPPASEVSP